VQARLDAQAGVIVHAATRVLSREGFAGLSMAAVAAEAGVATGTVYKHFSGKSELVTAVFREVVSREVAAVAQAAGTTRGESTGGSVPVRRAGFDAPGSAIERVVAAVETFAGRALKNPKLAYVLLAEPVDATVDVERLRFRRAFTDLYEGAVAEGVANGQLPPQNPRTSAAALIGAIGEVLVGPLAQEQHGEAVIPELVEFALRALGFVEPVTPHTTRARTSASHE
jgi:AcrR family transcriptional regulator